MENNSFNDSNLNNIGIVQDNPPYNPPQPEEPEVNLDYAYKPKFKLQKTQLFAIIALVLFLPAMIVMVRNTTRHRSLAAGEVVNLSFAPSSQSLPPNAIESVVLDAKTNKIGFINLTVNFDPTKIQLSGEVTTSALFKTIISKTDMITANSTGKINITLGLAPEDRANPPTGIIEVLQMPILAVTTNNNVTASVNFDNADIQIVDMTPIEVGFTLSSATLDINITATPTLAPISPTQTVGPSPTASTTPVATPKPIKIPRPTKTPRR